MEFSQTSSFCILIFLFIFVLFIFYLILNLLRKRVLCNCEICQTYISSSWVSQFPNLCDWYTHLLSKSPTQTIHLHVLGNTITANPTNVEYMLKTKFENFPKGKPFSMILGDLLGRGIFNVDGDRWKFQRKMANLELGRNSIRSYAVEVIHHEIHHRLIPLLDSFKGKEHGDHGTLDLQDVFKRFSFDCICKFSFGLDPKCLEISLPLSEFANSFDLASNLSAKRAMNIYPIIWKIKKILNIGSEKKLKKAIQKINILAKEMIKQKRKLGSSSCSTHKDLLSRFMMTTNDETYLRDIVISFILAGRDTISSALTSFFWHMAKNPHVQTSILSEAEKILGENQDSISCDKLRELHYLHAAVHESMRLLPAIQFDSKFCLQDDVLPDGVFVKKGTRVTYHPYAMGRMEKIWGKDCLEFKPERWLSENGEFCQENPFKYPVFQAGLRVCLGKEMAIVQLKSVAISLLRRFRIELVEEPSLLSSSTSSPIFLPGLTATFRCGLPVLVQERWAKDE